MAATTVMPRTPSTIVSEAAFSNDRLIWADFARCSCILLVVVYHLDWMHYMQLDWAISLPVRGAWREFHFFFTPIRMPLFFTISGTLATAALHRPWRQVAMRRIFSPYYVYVLWVLLTVPLYAALQSHVGALLVDSVWELVRILLLPPGAHLWYLYALAVYFLVAKALLAAPLGLVLPGAALLSVVISTGSIVTPGFLGEVLRYFVFFLAGVHLSAFIKTAASCASGSYLVLSAALYACAVAARYTLGVSFAGLHLLAGMAGVWLGVVASALLSRYRPAPYIASLVGRNTLPIFLMHVPIIALLNWLASDPAQSLWAYVLASNLAAALYPIALTIVIVAISLIIHRILLRAGARWLFGLPARPQQPAESGCRRAIVETVQRSV